MQQPRKYVDAKASDDLDYGRNFQILPKNHDSFLQPENIRMIEFIELCINPIPTSWRLNQPL